MNWVVLASFSALFEAVYSIMLKQGLNKLNELLVSFTVVCSSCIPLFLLLFVMEIPDLSPRFWKSLVLVTFLDLVGVICYMRALKGTDLSLALPLATFTPFFLMFSSPLMVGEYTSIMGCIGVSLIIVGSYVLNIQYSKHGFFAPFRALLSSRSSQLMLFCAAVYSITCNLHKICVVESSPFFYAIAHQCALGIALFPFALRILFKQENKKETIRKCSKLCIMGVIIALILICQMQALAIGHVVYVTAIKRTSILMSIILGAVILREGGIRQRFAGATVMVAGAVLTAF